ncbi:MAG: TetR/AcrR family transcriptional regulator [Rhodomicrobiaceae bacterium]
MGRKSTFEDRVIFAAVGAEIARNGTITLQDLSARTGVSIGSLYHRYASREALLAAAWYDAVRRSQSGFLAALRGASLETGKHAALATPRFCRAEHDAAIILACCRQSEFLKPNTPDELALAIAGVNDEAKDEIAAFARRVDRPLINCHLALVAYPLAAVKLFLPDRAVPESIDVEIGKAYDAAMRA